MKTKKRPVPMGDEKTEFGQRAVALEVWEWISGMTTICGLLVSEGGTDWLVGWCGRPTRDGGGWVDTGDSDGRLPDLTSPGTLGCIQHVILPKAWPGCRFWFEVGGGLGLVSIYTPQEETHVFDAPTLGEALLLALEAARDRLTPA